MNEPEQNHNPMVKIDGDRVKKLRESKGLTQLYVATVVEVTTDTISRWENRRYPTIKRENAEKLAEALEVEVDEILDQEELDFDLPPEPPPKDVPLFVASSSSSRSSYRSSPFRGRLFRLFLFTLVIVGGAAYSFVFMLDQGREQPRLQVKATRILPDHAPAGQPFPVLIRVESDSEASFSLIVRENLPKAAELLGSEPPITAAGRGAGKVKWVSRMDGRSKVFAYLVRSAAGAAPGEALWFSGQIMAGRQSGRPALIVGRSKVKLADFHWADLNRDNRIDDEEILAVYDMFSELEGFSFERDQLDDIWAAGGYRWNSESGTYEIP